MASIKNAIWENIFRRGNEEHSETAEALRNVPIFAGFSKRELREVERIVHHRDYKPGEVIFRQGDPGLGMYVIISGDVQIANNEDPDNPIVYSELSDGDFFGDMALVDDASRSATALSSGETRLISFFRPELQDIITRFPAIGNKLLMNLAMVIASRLRKTNEYLFTAQQKQAEKQA
ncbi:MAG: cyclic nucleotide-binding domain-containing protein [Candidatus Marinimicrobia bacterium]|nr:cyclic nucleotide-binding domain-containing protein [Candidatus Neomarinimicrobiota bacterium]